MPNQIEYTLSNNVKITAKQLADQLGITAAAARYRLKKSHNATIVFSSTKQLLAGDAKIWMLSDGTTGTVRDFSKLTGLKENTLRQRLALSIDRDHVLKATETQFEKLNANIYKLSDGSETTVQDFAKEMNISSSQAHDILTEISISVRQHRMIYQLSNGQQITLEDIINITGLSGSAAKKRINKSRIASDVLKPHRIKVKQLKNIKNNKVLLEQRKILIKNNVGLYYRMEEDPITGRLIKVKINK